MSGVTTITVTATGGNNVTVSASPGILDAPDDGNYYLRHNDTWAEAGLMALQSPAAVAITGGAMDGVTIGAVTPAPAHVTTLSASGQITSTVTTGTAPFVVASQTVVTNLNAALLLGSTWSAPAAIGGGTPSSGAFTTLSATGLLQTAATVTGSAGINLPQGTAPSAPNNGDVWMVAGGLYYHAGGVTVGPIEAGTVTSVALAMPGQFTVSGSPVTGSGTLTATWQAQLTNTFLAGPNGSTGAPTFRTIVSADINTALLTPGPIGTTTPDAATFETPFVLVDGTDETKTWSHSLSGMTTGVTLTLASAQSTSQTLNYPNITAMDTLATLGLAQTFTAAQTIASGTITANAPGLTISQTWNASGTSFEALDINITNSASAAGSRVINLRTGGSSQFNIDVSGNVACGNLGATGLSGSTLTINTTALVVNASSHTLIGTSTDDGVHTLQVNGTSKFFGNVVGTGTFNINPASSAANLLLSAPTGQSGEITISVNAVNQYQIAGNATNFTVQDLVNGTTPITYTPGILTAGVVAFANTTVSSSNTTGAVTIGGGLGVGGATYSASITLTGSPNQVIINAPASSSAVLVINAATGHDSIIQFVNNSTVDYTIHANTTQWYLNDNVNTWAPIAYTAGTSSAGTIAFAGSLDATTLSAASVTFTGGVGITKQLRVGSQITNNYGPAAATTAAYIASGTSTITGGVSDGQTSGIQLGPTYSAASALTVTRHNYIKLSNPVLSGAGPAALTDACVFWYDAAVGTHKALDSGTTKSSPGTVSGWEKRNVNGTIYYSPLYTSKTS